MRKYSPDEVRQEDFIRIACGSTLFVRKEPVNTFAHVTKMIDAIECIISQMEVNE